MKPAIFAMLVAFASCGGCGGERDSSCATDADCDEFERSVCQLGNCVCEFDELERCTCESQTRCDEVYGPGERTCAEGACRACVTDEDCGRLGECDPTGECEEIECLVDDDCEVGFCEGEDCVGCRTDDHCPGGWRCRADDGACVACEDTAQCAEGDVCDADVQLDSVEVVGTNQCGLDCAPQCREECADDPDCKLRPACVVDNPECVPEECVTWLGCELPEDCELRLGDCPDGRQCEALARSFVTPIHYACLDTPCLLDTECGEGRNCYEGLCLPACETQADCDTGTCVARVLFDGASCLTQDF